MSLDDTPICTAIITAPRPKPTLARSLHSFDVAGFSLIDSMVFADGPCDIDGISYRVNPTVLGNKSNWLFAMTTMLAISNTGPHPYPWYMVCEDDISWCPGAADALCRDLADISWHDRVQCISLYTPRRATKRVNPLPLGYHWEGMQYGTSTWGAQCYLFRRDWALKLMADPLLLQHAGNPNKKRNIDGIIGEVINNAGNVIAYRVPCLVEHSLGDGNSSLGYPPVRPDLQTDYYRGHP